MSKKKKRRKRGNKRKVTVSSEYNENEAEVRELLKKELVVQSSVDQREDDVLFFIGALENKTEIEKSDSSAKISETPEKSDTGATQLASSYVQIDDESPVIWRKCQPVDFDSGVLFYPSMEKNTEIQINEIAQVTAANEGFFVEPVSTSCNKNQNQMIDRFHKQGMLDATSKFLVETDFQSDKNLYKTISTKVFRPIFQCIKLDQQKTVPLERDNLLIFTLTKIRFTDHPTFTQEHKLASSLENLCSVFSARKQTNLVLKISSELNTVRSIVKTILQEANHKNANELEGYVNKTKFLRESLHQEEKINKDLITKILSTWKTLKETRRKQNFNATTVKLSIIVDESLDMNKEEEKWNERFNIELDELLREAYEAYYRRKRIKKALKRENKVTALSPVRKPDVDQLQEELKRVFKENLPNPRDPKLSFHLDHINRSGNVPIESIRKYYLKLYFDGHHVWVTRNYKLLHDFGVNLSETYTVLLEKRIPEHIKIEIYEKARLSPDTKICDLHVPFSRNQVFLQNHEESLQFSNPKRNISGALDVTISFEKKTINRQPSDMIELAPIKSKTQMSKDVLQNWYENELVDPLDPDCLSLYQTVNTSRKTYFENVDKENECFILNEDIYAFCSKDEIENNKRFKMLTARFNSDMKYKDLTLVPIFEREFVEKAEEKIIDESDWMDPVHLQRHRGKKFLRELYDAVANLSDQMSKNQKSFNLLIGDEPPTFSSIINSIMQMFGPRRPLNPPKKSTISRLSMRPNSYYNFNIVVNVIRSTGVPTRSAAAELGRRNSSVSTAHHTFKFSNVRPYISVNYQDKNVRTVSVDGSNPTWNEQLVIPVAGHLGDFKGDIKFQLFDEYIEDLISDDRSRLTEVYQRIYGKWLGEFRLPITTILTSQKIEGVFELDSPKILVGYTRPTLETSETTINVEDVPEIREVVYLSLLISLEPQFDIVSSSTEYLETSELRDIKEHIRLWSIEVRTNYPDRFIDPLITLCNGKRVCMTRLLEPVPLPFESDEHTEKLIRRFVSLIPVYKSLNNCCGLNGVWLNNQLILDTSWGSSKDLGVLLACYYMTLGVRVFLVLGTGYQYGDSTFVMFVEDNNFVIVDPGSGRKYSSRDIFCPLIKVLCVVDQNNIYANIQSEERVSMMNFDVNDSSCWMPLFSKKNPAPIGGVHDLSYIYQTSFPVADLRKTIERKIIKKINSWRSNRKTVWNRAFQDVLHQILAELEEEFVFDRKDSDFMEKMSLAFPTYKISGFTLNMPYTNLSSISEKIKGTGIHLNSDKKVEFSLSVYVRQYPNNILSIWIFLISLIPYV